MHKKYINQIQTLSDQALQNFNDGYKKFNDAKTALKVNLEDFPRGTTLPINEKENPALAKANLILLEANASMDDTMHTIEIKDEYDEEYKDKVKKHETILNGIPEARKGIGAAIVLVILGLLLVGFYVFNTFLKPGFIPIPIPDEYMKFVNIGIVGIGTVLALIGFITLILCLVSISNRKAELDDRMDLVKKLKREEEELLKIVDGLALSYENALASLIAIEDNALQKIKELPDKGEALFAIRDQLGFALDLIASERCVNISEVFRLVDEERRHKELMERLTWNKRYYEEILKEIRNQNRIAIAGLTNGDIHLD